MAITAEYVNRANDPRRKRQGAPVPDQSAAPWCWVQNNDGSPVTAADVKLYIAGDPALRAWWRNLERLARLKNDEAARGRYVTSLPRSLARPGARVALEREAGAARRSPWELLRDLYGTSLLLALGDVARPQAVRLGRLWMKGSDSGRVLEFVPLVLAAVPVVPGALDEWLRQRTLALADEALTSPRGDAMQHAMPLPLRLPAPPERDGEPSRLDGLLAVAAPRERCLLALLLAGLTSDQAARRLRLAPGTVGAMKARLKKKLTAL